MPEPLTPAQLAAVALDGAHYRFTQARRAAEAERATPGGLTNDTQYALRREMDAYAALLFPAPPKPPARWGRPLPATLEPHPKGDADEPEHDGTLS